jgi:hypothetical protein
MSTLGIAPDALTIRASSLGDSSADENLPHTTLIFLIGGKCLELLRVSLLLLFRGSELVVSVRCFLNFNDQSSSVQISSGNSASGHVRKFCGQMAEQGKYCIHYRFGEQLLKSLAPFPISR